MFDFSIIWTSLQINKFCRMNSNSPAQFVPSTPRFRCTTDAGHTYSTPVAVVPNMRLSLERTIGEVTEVVPMTTEH